MATDNAFGTIIKISGTAMVRIGGQEPMILQPGDILMPGQVLILGADSRVEFDNGVILAGPVETTLSPDMLAATAAEAAESVVTDLTVEQVLAALESGGDLLENIEEAAAGLEGDAGGDGFGFVRLSRISEVALYSDSDELSTTETVSPTSQDDPLYNYPPEAGDDSATVDEDGSINIDVLANDRDRNGDALTIVDLGAPSHGSVSVNPDGTVHYVPDPDYNGPDSFTYTVSDGSGATDSATVSVSVRPVNDAPVGGSIPTQEASDGEVVSLDVSAAFSDIEGDTLTYSASGLPEGLSIDPATGVISGAIAAGASDATDDNNNNQLYTVTVIANDGSSDSNPVQFVWAVNNTVPEFDSGVYDFDVYENTIAGPPPVGTVAATDADGDSLSYSIISGNESGLFALDSATGHITLTETIDDPHLGDYVLQVLVDDGEGGSDVSTVNITLNNVNDPPVITVYVPGGDDNTPREDVVIVTGGLVVGSDVDEGAELTYAIDSEGSYGNFDIDPVTGEWTYTLNNDSDLVQSLAEGETHTETFPVSVTDEFGASDESVVVITVVGTNDVPEIISEVQSGSVQDSGSTTATGAVAAQDVDNGAILEYSGDTSGAYGDFSVDPVSGEWTYQLNTEAEDV
uniref:retention module-containing protein n=1 Tax=Spongiibacter sp. TaxID=2024860 RepID=UPI0035683A7A